MLITARNLMKCCEKEKVNTTFAKQEWIAGIEMAICLILRAHPLLAAFHKRLTSISKRNRKRYFIQ